MAKVTANIAAAEAALARFGERRLALLESGDIAAARRLDADIATVAADVAALRDRAAILERKVADEARERDAAALRAAIVKQVAPVQRKHLLALEVEDTLAGFAVACRRYRSYSNLAHGRNFHLSEIRFNPSSSEGFF